MDGSPDVSSVNSSAEDFSATIPLRGRQYLIDSSTAPDLPCDDFLSHVLEAVLHVCEVHILPPFSFSPPRFLLDLSWTVDGRDHRGDGGRMGQRAVMAASPVKSAAASTMIRGKWGEFIRSVRESVRLFVSCLSLSRFDTND